MIEDDQLLEVAEETGYRLCSYSNSPTSVDFQAKEHIFSVTWDTNVPGRIFICSQNGRLRVITDGIESCYRVSFKRYTTGYQPSPGSAEEGIQVPNILNGTRHVPPVSDERIVDYHWDKMTTIPDRPDEIIFLLGVSRTVMYTALPGLKGPYPEEPFISSTTRGDFSGHIYGTPVMKLSNHTSRVTSLACVASGQLLASGDETGTLKLTMLVLLDNLSIAVKKERKTKKNPHQRLSGVQDQFTEVKASYKLSRRVHHGPLFSLNWLPLSVEVSEDDRRYVLATGSADRSVNLWQVNCSTQDGISLQCLLSLHTVMTNAMCLGSLLLHDNETRRRVAAFVRSAAKSQVAQRLAAKKNKETGVFQNITSSDTLNVDEESCALQSKLLESASSVFLSAGTHTGAVYTWRVPANLLLNQISKKTAVADVTSPPLSDDGTLLHSLLQTSGSPIIQLSLADVSLDSQNKFDNSRRRVVLCTADLTSTLRVYAEMDVTSEHAENWFADLEEASNVRVSNSNSHSNVSASPDSNCHSNNSINDHNHISSNTGMGIGSGTGTNRLPMLAAFRKGFGPLTLRNEIQSSSIAGETPSVMPELLLAVTFPSQVFPSSRVGTICEELSVQQLALAELLANSSEVNNNRFIKRAGKDSSSLRVNMWSCSCYSLTAESDAVNQSSSYCRCQLMTGRTSGKLFFLDPFELTLENKNVFRTNDMLKATFSSVKESVGESDQFDELETPSLFLPRPNAPKPISYDTKYNRGSEPFGLKTSSGIQEGRGDSAPASTAAKIKLHGDADQISHSTSQVTSNDRSVKTVHMPPRSVKIREEDEKQLNDVISRESLVIPCHADFDGSHVSASVRASTRPEKDVRRINRSSTDCQNRQSERMELKPTPTTAKSSTSSTKDSRPQCQAKEAWSSTLIKPFEETAPQSAVVRDSPSSFEQQIFYPGGPVASSPLAYPTLHSAARLAPRHFNNNYNNNENNDADADASQSEDDSISISTIVTTSTDRRIAIKHVEKTMRGMTLQNMNTSTRNNSYGRDRDSDRDNKQKTGASGRLSKVSKQIDVDWLRIRQTQGPSLEDISMLYPPDAIVDVKMGIGLDGIPEQSNKKCEPLTFSMHKNTQFPQFDINFSINDFFPTEDNDEYLSESGSLAQSLSSSSVREFHLAALSRSLSLASI